ncbi:MAG: C10 family peptidase [Prevotellaceae bacterium]|jgi:hypothetical protein|nr:C10 family peptidase [Prevotellaceae bacterium]
MERYIYFGLITLFTLAACDKNEVLDEQTPSRQKASGKIIYVDNVNVEVARVVAEGFYADANGNPSRVQILSIDSIIDWEGKTAIYVFDFDPQGFVLTSADIRNEPIIGYSSEINFLTGKKDMPAGLVCLLAETMIVNRWLQEAEQKQEDEPQKIIGNNTNSWFSELARRNNEFSFRYNPDVIIFTDPCDYQPRTLVSTEVQGEFDYYCKTKWDQDEPYNYFVPNYYPAGCVAVATAQIMKFHQRPAVFNWSIMPNSCTSTYSTVSAGEWEVARLLKDIGDRVDMDYGVDRSGADSDKARKALENNYGYSKSAEYKDYNFQRVQTELRTQKHPVYVEGYGTQEKVIDWGWLLQYSKYSDGHAYIIDGITNLVSTYQYTCNGETKAYKNYRELWHYNFGWSGDYDFWFSNSIVDIAGRYKDKDVIMGKIFPNFKYYRKCIYDIKP